MRQGSCGSDFLIQVYAKDLGGGWGGSRLGFGARILKLSMVQKEQFVSVEAFGPVLTDELIELKISKRMVTPYTGSEVSFATTESGQQVVIKASAREGGAVREWRGLARAYVAKLPVPEPMALVKTQAGQLALVTERINGKMLYYSPQNEARHNLGGIVKTMHKAVPVEGNGWIESGKADFSYYDSRLHAWRQGHVENIDAKSKAQGLLNSLAHPMIAHCESITPGFNHNDIHDGQVIVRGRKITLIDFEEWIEESPLNDVAYYLYSSVRMGTADNQFRYFLNGYLGNEVFSEVEKGALMFYLLYISCRAMNFFSSRPGKFAEVATTTHRKVIDYVEDEKLWKDF